ncbi:uncharacterized protein BDW47DRAFT_122459 [Aspergillus candidus]|uniref:Transmembrane protein n=1 Tax=Aspergillus candidus TaxID=41067 RepID=A0A2I2FN21_ASPCN|nr:hypothetical protein BDW47DRAFT_122459 [Aspergillus candidus]PLB42030.1 hypothetical protein BDW47DRAFT_122459 [Aspergillus candidus]
MAIYSSSDNNNNSSIAKGMKVAIGSITLSILASWFVFAARRRFSPSEAIAVLLLLQGLSFPAKTMLLAPENIVSDAFGTLLFLVGEQATWVALIWMFADLVDTLHPLQTENVFCFFFAKVSIDGWFRYLMLVFCVVSAMSSLFIAYKILRILKIAWHCHRQGRTEVNERENEMINHITGNGIWDLQPGLRVLRWIALVVFVASVELTLRWNHLSPSRDLWSPGQLIPLVTGIIAFVDSCLVAGQQVASSGIAKKTVALILQPLIQAVRVGKA